MKGHWDTVCTAKHTTWSQGRQHQRSPRSTSAAQSSHVRSKATVSTIEECPDADTMVFQTISMDSLRDSQSSARDQAFVNLQLDVKWKDRPTELRAKVDTGAQGNVLPLRIYREMFPSRVDADGQPMDEYIEKSSMKLISYGGAPITQHGVCTLTCTYQQTTRKTRFFVTDAPGPAIIGLPSLEAFKIVSLNCGIKTKQPVQGKADLIGRYPDCFEGIGKFETQYHITLDPTVQPVVHPARRVPFALKPDIKKELDSMEQQGVIRKVGEGEPTDWVNSLVYRRKANGQLRICLDPKDLNKAIRRDHHVTPTLEEILPKFNGAKYFSILDAKSGYWNVELDEPSSYLTTFNSPFGRYRFLRMPFGLRMAQDVFQRRIDQLLEGCPGATGIADDIVVYGHTEEEHDDNLHTLMERCVGKGLKLNPEKIRIKEPEIKFFGVICSADGVRADPKKTSALLDMPAPTNRQELLSFLGLATYMGTFIPNLSNKTAPLRELTAKNAIFQWTPNHQQAFNDVKNAITAETTLSYFDPSKPITVQVDASMAGLGAALIQEDRPVAFASRALSDTESRYANIEREMLAVIFGCERFYHFIFGQEVTVESDHKPLESIHLKRLHSAPSRLRRMLLRLQPYDIQIRYRPGPDVSIADALSRLPSGEACSFPDMDVQIHDIHPQFTEDVLTRLKAATQQDEELAVLREVIFGGWPDQRKEAPKAVQGYWNYRDELAIEDGLLVKGERIIIPRSMVPDILTQLHSAHQGGEKMKLRARATVFWTGINQDIDSTVSRCSQCQEMQPKQQREPMTPSEVPPRAWHTVGADLFTLDGEYLIAADYYSKYPFVFKLGSTESYAVIEKLKILFAEQGVPASLRTDNGPQFVSHKFRKFAEEFGFQHVTSSPYHPQGNGFIESQVKIVKHALSKAMKNGQDPAMALLCLRATPIDRMSKSPAEILLGRKIQDNLPRRFIRKPEEDKHYEHLNERQQEQKREYDQHARPLPIIVPGQPVNVRNPLTSRWEPGRVTDVLPHRSVEVDLEKGSHVRRNRADVRESDVPRQSEAPTRPPVKTPEAPTTNQSVQLPEGTAREDGQYTTRSGRVVKQPVKLDL